MLEFYKSYIFKRTNDLTFILKCRKVADFSFEKKESAPCTCPGRCVFALIDCVNAVFLKERLT